MHHTQLQSIWAFYNPLGASIKKTFQTAGYQFTFYRSGKKKKIFKQACAVHLVFTGSHPKMHFQTHMLYLCLQFCVLVMSIIHIWFSALSSKRKMSKNNRFCRAKKAYLLLHAVC